MKRFLQKLLRRFKKPVKQIPDIQSEYEMASLLAESNLNPWVGE